MIKMQYSIKITFSCVKELNVFGYKRSDKAVKFKIGGVFFIRKVRFIFYFLNFVRQMLIEKQILSDLKKSDRSAFQSLFRYYYPRLKAYAATMVDDSVAEDLVQDLFLYVWEHREDLIMGASFHSYLFQGIYSRCVDYFRKYASYDSCDMEVYEEYLTEQAAFLQNDDEAWEELYAKDFYQQLYELLKEIPEYFGKETPVVVVREATKVHQEILRGSAEELEEKYASRSWKGECVVIIGAPEEDLSPEDESEEHHE